MEKKPDQLTRKTNELIFDISYGEYLQKKYPNLYQEGVKMAVEEYHCHPKSMAAFLYAIGFVKGFISKTELAKFLNPKRIQ